MAFLGQRTLTRRRYAAGSYDATGSWVRGTATDSSFLGSLQPLSGRDRHILPDGLRTPDTRKVYCPSGTLRTENQHDQTPADEVLDGSEEFTVVHVDDSHPVIPHDRAYLQRKREGP